MPYPRTRTMSQALPFEAAVVMPAGDGGFQSNNYPTIVTLPDGRLFLNWSAQDGKTFRIVGTFSNDDGKTWSEPETIIDTPGCDDFDPNIVLTRDEIQVYSTTTVQPMPVVSDAVTWKVTRKFDGTSWSKPVVLPPPHNYVCGKIHAGLTLADGTLLMPYAWEIAADSGNPTTSEATCNLKSGALL